MKSSLPLPWTVKFLSLLSLVPLVGCMSEREPPQIETAYPVVQAVYTVGEYDTAADPAADLQQTIERAQQENKRIILQVGGSWCQYCHLLDKYIRETASVAQALHDHFLIMKVTFDRKKNKNEEFLSQYPEVAGYPHWFVLDSDGKLLYSLDTSTIEEGSNYSEEKFLAFLADWEP